jgi:dTDP-4-amino-4,6-dideoxygalactose transaminase
MIRLSKSCLSSEEKDAVLGVLDREFLGMGMEVQSFENGLADFFDRPAVCVVNGTAALQLALQAVGVGPGDEVLVPSLTYLASFQAISATGAKAVACDVLAGSLTLDSNDAEKLITSRTKAIMPVHYAGGVTGIDALYKLALKYGLRVIEDAAHAFGTIHNGRKVGGFGDIVCFSFDGIKNITSGEGGCVVTNDTVILEKIRDARLLGVEKDTDKRYSGQRSWQFDVSAQGWRYHMSNIMAAIGIVQLKRFPDFALARQKLASLYDQLLVDELNISALVQDYNYVVPHIYPIQILSKKPRKLIQDTMLEKGIQTGIHYQPNHQLSYYKSNREFPVTDSVAQRLLTLPLHPDVSEEDVRYICATLIDLVNGPPVAA